MALTYTEFVSKYVDRIYGAAEKRYELDSRLELALKASIAVDILIFYIEQINKLGLDTGKSRTLIDYLVDASIKQFPQRSFYKIIDFASSEFEAIALITELEFSGAPVTQDEISKTNFDLQTLTKTLYNYRVTGYFATNEDPVMTVSSAVPILVQHLRLKEADLVLIQDVDLIFLKALEDLVTSFCERKSKVGSTYRNQPEKNNTQQKESEEQRKKEVEKVRQEKLKKEREKEVEKVRQEKIKKEREKEAEKARYYRATIQEKLKKERENKTGKDSGEKPESHRKLKPPPLSSSKKSAETAEQTSKSDAYGLLVSLIISIVFFLILVGQDEPRNVGETVPLSSLTGQDEPRNVDETVPLSSLEVRAEAYRAEGNESLILSTDFEVLSYEVENLSMREWVNLVATLESQGNLTTKTAGVAELGAELQVSRDDSYLYDNRAILRMDSVKRWYIDQDNTFNLRFHNPSIYRISHLIIDHSYFACDEAARLPDKWISLKLTLNGLAQPSETIFIKASLPFDYEFFKALSQSPSDGCAKIVGAYWSRA
jgi:outer membrane biosynthesis protein TonB